MATMAKFKTVDEYFSALPSETKNLLKEVRKTIKKAAPGVEEVISYNIPSFKGLIWYAAWKEHISLYPTNPAMEASIKGLSAYVASKGTIKFPIDEPVPYGLITKIVKFKLNEKGKKKTEKAKR
jgi:uncharacterized protein YdhG (YjbR/CyaY superfamily)